MNVSLTTVDGRHTLHIQRRFAHPIDKVWRAMTEPEHLSVWYPLRTERVDLTVGATIDLFDQEGNHYRAEVTEVEPGRVLAFREDGVDDVRWELRPDGDGTLVAFTHSFDVGPPPASHATGWHVCFDILGAHLDQRTLPPRLHDDDLERRYAEGFAQG
jgi:uncharacterized protein YndB with AHSA1/START domain